MISILTIAYFYPCRQDLLPPAGGFFVAQKVSIWIKLSHCTTTEFVIYSFQVPAGVGVVIRPEGHRTYTSAPDPHCVRLTVLRYQRSKPVESWSKTPRATTALRSFKVDEFILKNPTRSVAQERPGQKGRRAREGHLARPLCPEG